MNITDYQEIWQVDTGGQVFEARFEEMAQWIFDDSLLPQDLVRRGNLRWIEARKVPALLQFFNEKAAGQPPPVFATTTKAPSNLFNAPPENIAASHENFAIATEVSANPYQTTIIQNNAVNFEPPQNPFNAPPASNFENQTNWSPPSFNEPFAVNEPAPHEFNILPTADFCSLHPDTEARFLCGTCGNGFCPICPKSYGGTVKICPFCGALCKPVKEIIEKMHSAVRYERDLSKGFGFEDFFEALAYPFRFKSSLILGAIMFMVFSLGQGAASMANMLMAAGAIACWMLTNTLTFGVLANIVENFSQGKIGSNFMPSFDEFSIWDDVVHPFFLFLGTYIVSFGLLFLFVGGVVLFSWTTFNGKKPLTFEDRIKVAQYEKEKREGKFYGDPDSNVPRTAEEKDLQDLQKQLQNQRQKEVESVAGKTVEQEESDQKEIYNNFLNLGIPAIVTATVLLLFGIFYYPAACMVAGYTRSFGATIRPGIGFETIKLLGWDYLKLVAMCVVIGLAMGLIGLALGAIFRAFHLPGIGNLPANAIGALFMFYFSVVYAVILGFALYKNADKLNLYKA